MPLAKLMIQFPAMLRVMTYAVLKWEFYGAFLFIIPFKPQYLRCLGCFGFFFFHFGLAINMRLAAFFWYASLVIFFSIFILFSPQVEIFLSCQK